MVADSAPRPDDSSTASAGFRVAVVTLFPELFATFLRTSLVKRAISENRLSVHLECLREHGLGRHRSVDDTPYGGGAGMVMRVDCLMNAIASAEHRAGFAHNGQRILLSPQGRRFDQSTARRIAALPNVVLVCGRYEGFDERVRHFVNDEISLGDFILTGGEIPAMAVIEACIRLLPGVLGNQESAVDESFSLVLEGGLEYPQYTRPADYQGLGIPEVLKSGDHRRIEAWRREQSLERTLRRRPDLLARPGDSPDYGGP
jgi:tRNA (guanine37-N1)-methyltransferase